MSIGFEKIEWPTLALIGATYAAWFGTGALLYPVAPFAALAVLGVLNAMHSSLVHETIHGHPTRNARVNEALVFANPGFIWPYRRYRNLHLCHHADERLTDPFDDPESYYRALWHYENLPILLQRLLGWSNTLLGRMILGPPMAAIALWAGDISLMRKGDRSIRFTWVLHALGLIPILLLVVFVFEIPLWLYIITSCWGGASIISLRTFAEHQWHESPQGRTIIVEKSPLSFLFLNNNLHFVHHQSPNMPWYSLPGLYRSKPAHWHALNQGYVYPNYWSLFRSYALVAKEPVTHPAWHRSRGAK